MSKELKDKLNQTDAESVVKNTTMNEVVKQASKLPTSEQLAITSEVVDVELDAAGATPEQKVKVKSNLKKGKDGGDSLTKKFTGALKFLMPQMVGAAVGGIAGGGSRGAIQGATLAGQAAQGYREEIRKEKQLKLQSDNMAQLAQLRNRLQQTQVVHSDTGTPLQLNPQTGQYVDPNGNVIPPAKLRNLQLERESRLSRSTDDKISRGGRREGRLERQFTFRKDEKDELSDKQLETVTGFDNALDTVASVEELAPGVTTGPIESRVQAAQQIFDTAPEDFTKLKVELTNLVADFLRSKSGLVVSDAERDFLKQGIPDTNDAPKVLATKLEQFQTIVNRGRNRYVNNLQEFQGKLRDKKTEFKKEDSKIIKRDVSSMSPRQKLEYYRKKKAGK